MRVGVIGVGRIGAAHAEVVRSHPDVTDVVVADTDPERAGAVAERLDIAVATIDEVVSAVDAVVVAATTDAHADLIVRGVRAGLPVFCEKPVARDVAGTLAVQAEVDRVDAPVQIGFQRRFDAGYRAARQALRDGSLGELRRAHLVTCDPHPPHESYIPRSGGIYRDLHVHDFEILRWVTGRKIVEVHATGAARGADVFKSAGDVDESVALLGLEDGTLATMHGSRYNGAGYDVRMELAGTRATWVVGLDERVPLRSAEPGASFPAGPSCPGFWERFTGAYVAEIAAFIQLVQGRAASGCTVAEALEALYVADAADRSRREHRTVRVDEVRSQEGVLS